MNYITLDRLTYRELLRFEQECDGLNLHSGEDRALQTLIEVAESHPDTDL